MRLSPKVSHPEQNPLQQSRLISQQQQLPDREREREFPGAGIFLIDNANVFCAKENALVCSPAPLLLKFIQRGENFCFVNIFKL